MDKKYFLIFILSFCVVNIAVSLLPNGPYMSMFKNSIKLSKKFRQEYEVILYGDSKGTMFNKDYFDRKILSLACENNSILFSKFLHDGIINSQKKSLKVVIIFLGPNNYNKNGIFVTRDFGLRRLAKLSDIPAIIGYDNGFDNALEIISSKLIPIYARRMEIRDFDIVKNMVSLKYENLLTQGMRHNTKQVDLLKISAIDKSADRNYLLTYKRSVYNNFELSHLHTQFLLEIINVNSALGISTVLIQLPIKNEMLELQKSLVKQGFDELIDKIIESNDILYFDLRNQNYDFSDINHLSSKGAYDLTKNFINPLIEKLILSR